MARAGFLIARRDGSLIFVPILLLELPEPACNLQRNHSGQQRSLEANIRSLIVFSAAVLVISAAHAATTYEGDGRVPEQFVLSGKAADRLHDHASINLA